jgi:hypothetical protein
MLNYLYSRQPKELLFQQLKYLFYEDILYVCEAYPSIQILCETDSLFVDLIQLKKRVVYEIACYCLEFSKTIEVTLHAYGEVSFTATFEFEVRDMQTLIRMLQSCIHIYAYGEITRFMQNRETQQTRVFVVDKETLTIPTDDLIRLLTLCDEVPADHQRIIYGDHSYRDLPLYKEGESRDIMD